MSFAFNLAFAIGCLDRLGESDSSQDLFAAVSAH